jgi:hypothetical protein
MSAPPEPRPATGTEGCLAVALGTVLGLIAATSVSMGLITLNLGLYVGPSRTGHSGGCGGPQLALAALDVAVAAAFAALGWYVFFGLKRRGMWVLLVRVALAFVVAVALIPWPCGATYGVVVALRGCR